MKKRLSKIIVVSVTMLCLLVSGKEVTINAETTILNQELKENKKDLSGMLYYTEAESGETTLVDMMDFLSGKIEEDKDYISSGNMSIAPRFDVGDKDRAPVDDANTYPYSAIALVEVVYTNGDVDYGTGFFISRQTMLTAAHVLVEGNLQIERVNVYKSCNGYATTPTAQASGWYICADFDDDIVTDYDDDYAVLRFSSNVSQTWFGLYVPANPADLLGNGRHVAGYPHDMCNRENHEFYMCTAGGEVVNYHLCRIDHEIDTDTGESGAPVFRYNYSQYQWESLAINVGGQSTTFFGITININYGRRITSDLYNWLLNNSYITV